MKNALNQSSFLDSDYYCSQLIPAKSFFRKFKELIDPLVTDEMFGDLYCLKNGRPPISPALLAKAMLLQYHMNLSDREIERACQFDLEVKFALGLRIDERPFDHSSLGDFRDRLLKSGKEKEIFDSVVKALIKGKLIKKDQVQRIDATHIAADIALPGMVAMVKKSTLGVLKKLKTTHPDLYRILCRKIDLTEYTKSSVNDEQPGRLDLEVRAKRLVKFVRDARGLVEGVREAGFQEEVKSEIEILETILAENIDELESGEIKEKDIKDKPSNRIISPIDAEARAGAKSKFKKFYGYKTTITQETENHFITSVEVMPGNRPDAKGFSPVSKVLKKFGMKPQKIIGDTAYSDGLDRQHFAERGTRVVAPFREKNSITNAVFPKRLFDMNRETNELTCPAGVTAQPHFYDSEKGSMSFHFPMTSCKICPLKEHCTNAKEGRRTVRIFDFQEMLYDAEDYNHTEAFRHDMRLRPQIEGKFSEMKRLHGLGRARYRGLKKMGLQSAFTASIVNIKRWVRIENMELA